MRLAAVRTSEDDTRLAVEQDGEYFRLDYEGGLEALLREGGDPRELMALESLGRADDGVRLAAPLRPRMVIAIGLNYMDHIRECNEQPPSRPLVFAKFPSAVVGPYDAIELDSTIAERVDWEVELAAVVGTRLRCAAPDEALDSVLGWTVANDVSARDVQFADGQWTRGKSLDTFCPLGPVVVTSDEIANPQALRLTTRVNGETVQDSSTAEMVFGAAELLSFCSRSFTLEPGDVLLTGTPWGCGEFMHPKRWLRPGDVVETEVETIGSMRNPVVAVDPLPSASSGRRA